MVRRQRIMHGGGSCDSSSCCVANSRIISVDREIEMRSIPRKERMTAFECRNIEGCVDLW